MKYPEHLLKLISLLRKLPGVGSKSAERFAFHLLEWSEEKLVEMGQVIQDIRKFLKNCSECGSLKGDDPQCPFCDLTTRDSATLCIIATSKDLFAIEETRDYRGLYHVLGTLLSPIHGRIPQIEPLKERINRLGVKEIIIALDATLEGDATALYLIKELEVLGVTLSRLALGLPMGSSLDFIDGGTLARALSDRRRLH